jgi:hypothetical protein
METTRREFLGTVGATAAVARAAVDSPNSGKLDGCAIARRHCFVRTQPAPDFFEGLLLGNGDVQLCLTVRPDALGLHLGKSDVWDIRVSEEHIKDVLPWPEFLRLWEKASEEAKRQGKPEATRLEGSNPEFRAYAQKMHSSYSKPWPRPWPCGVVWLHWDSRMVRVVRQTLDPSDGSVLIELEYDNLRGRTRKLDILCFVNQHTGHISVSSTAPAPILSVAYYPYADSANPLPRPEVGAHSADGAGEFDAFQVLPFAPPTAEQPSPGSSEKESSFALFGRVAGRWSPSEERNRPFLKAAADEQPLRLDLVLMTPADHKENRRQAKAEASRLASLPVPRIRQSAAGWWREFWSHSAVEMADKEFERLWYQNQYLLACCLRAGKPAPGLLGNWTSGKIGTAWHGDYHMNYNLQQAFWGVFSSNHVDQHLPYVALIEKLLPMAQWSAKNMFGLPGAYFPHTSYPVPSEVNPYPCPPWGYEICETPWAVQSLWWHYLYTLDDDYLRRAYPLLKAAADFLMAYVKKGEDGRYHIIPTVSPENYGHTVDFRLNRDCIIDLALTEFLLDGMVEASTVLKVDAELRPKWADVRRNLAPYPKGRGPFGDVWLDVVDAPLEWVYNVPVTLAPVFPCDQVGLDRGQDKLALARNTIRTVRLEGGNDLVWQPLARARAGLLDLEWFRGEVRYCLMPNGSAFDRVRQIGGRYRDSTDFDFMKRMGVWIENLSLPAVLNECMLQSYAGVIRLFPNTKNLKPARFERLRAQRAFLVSAGWDGAAVASPVRIDSEKGAVCKLVNPWGKSATRVVAVSNGREIAVKHAAAAVLEFPTARGESYRIEKM